jgi:hypothetical protein
MVTAELTWRPGKSVKIHWPRHASVDQMQGRICAAFRQRWRLVEAVVTYSGRELFSFEKPWLSLARRDRVELDVSFVMRSPEEVGELYWCPGQDADESDGYSTASDIELYIDNMDGWGL